MQLFQIFMNRPLLQWKKLKIIVTTVMHTKEAMTVARKYIVIAEETIYIYFFIISENLRKITNIAVNLQAFYNPLECERQLYSEFNGSKIYNVDKAVKFCLIIWTANLNS